MNTATQTNQHQSWIARPAALLPALWLAWSVLLTPGAAKAGTDVWNGGAVPDGNWLNPGNWNGIAPATNDLLIFTGGTQTTTTNNYPAGTPFNNLSFSSTASAFS